MSILLAVIAIAIGFFLLTKAADEFVEGAANVAHGMQVSPVVIGAVIVGFGTSAPELLVSASAAARGELELGVGNVVGSNVANLTLVLGAAALIVPLWVGKDIMRREGPLSVASVLLFGFLSRGGLTFTEGAILAAVLVGFMGWIISSGRVADEDAVEIEEGATVGGQLARTFVGLVGTVLGAQLLVWGATTVADEAGVSEGLVGFTLVAIGTSLPELVTAVTAARKGETELILGNLLGSNIFNSLAVGGALGLVGPGPINDEKLMSFGMTSMALVSVISFVFMVTRKKIDKLEAVILLAIWLGTVVFMAT